MQTASFLIRRSRRRGEEQEEREVAALVAFYKEHRPDASSFYNEERIKKIRSTFQRKAAKEGVDYVQVMCSHIKKTVGVDPKAVLQQAISGAVPAAAAGGTQQQPEPEPEPEPEVVNERELAERDAAATAKRDAAEAEAREEEDAARKPEAELENPLVRAAGSSTSPVRLTHEPSSPGTESGIMNRVRETRRAAIIRSELHDGKITADEAKAELAALETVAFQQADTPGGVDVSMEVDAEMQRQMEEAAAADEEEEAAAATVAAAAGSAGDGADVSKEVCNNYLSGKCTRGEKCRRLHEPAGIPQAPAAEKPKPKLGDKASRGKQEKLGQTQPKEKAKEEGKGKGGRSAQPDPGKPAKVSISVKMMNFASKNDEFCI